MMAKRETGFTLIELMVAVAIIGVLASLGLTHFSVYQDNAFHTIAKAELHNARTALNARNIEDSDYNLIFIYVNNDASIDSVTAGESLDSILPGYEHTRGVTLFLSAYGDNSVMTGHEDTYLQHCNGPQSTSNPANKIVWHWIAFSVGGTTLTEREDVSLNCV